MSISVKILRPKWRSQWTWPFVTAVLTVLLTYQLFPDILEYAKLKWYERCLLGTSNYQTALSNAFGLLEGGDRGTSILLRHLTDEKPLIRVVVAKTLISPLIDNEILASLEAVAREDPSPEVRAVAADVLYRSGLVCKGLPHLSAAFGLKPESPYYQIKCGLAQRLKMREAIVSLLDDIRQKRVRYETAIGVFVLLVGEDIDQLPLLEA